MKSDPCELLRLDNLLQPPIYLCTQEFFTKLN